MELIASLAKYQAVLAGMNIHNGLRQDNKQIIVMILNSMERVEKQPITIAVPMPDSDGCELVFFRRDNGNCDIRYGCGTLSGSLYEKDPATNQWHYRESPKELVLGTWYALRLLLDKLQERSPRLQKEIAFWKNVACFCPTD